MILLVSGASSGLGKATSEKALEEGFNVIGIDISPSAIEHENYTHLLIDLSKLNLEVLRKHLGNEEWYGFVHCAGISIGSTIEEITIEDWNQSMEVNVTSAMLICQLADELMVDNGRIILVSSPVAIAGARKPSYAASKAALHGLTMSVSRSFGKRGICVNTVLPGPMITGMTNDWPVEKRASIASETRLNRLAKPEDVAYVITQMLDKKWSYMSSSIVDLTCGSLYGH